MRKKVVRKRTTVVRKTQRKKSLFSGKWLRYLIITFFLALLLGLGFHYRNGLAYYFSFKSDKVIKADSDAKRISDVRNFQVLENHEGKSK